jgi:hypothetical protein
MKTFFISLTVAALCTAQTFAEPMGTGFTYQGHLNDGGVPANGNYDMIFNLYDAPTNGNVLGSFSIFGAVPVVDGRFTVQLNAYNEFGPSAFNGEARWLQIGVRTNKNSLINPWIDLSPRQPLMPAACALFASSAVQAANADTAKSATSAQTADTAAVANVANSVAWANITGIPAGFADGVDNDATYAAGAGLSLSPSREFSVTFGTNGLADAAARSDHQHFGAKWGGSASWGIGLSVTNTSGTFAAGIYGQQGDGSGFPYFFGSVSAGVWGESSQGSGVYGASGYENGNGVFGYAAKTNGSSAGVGGQSVSSSGIGVRGLATATTGKTAGVRGESASDEGSGVFGLATAPTGETVGVRGDCVSSGGTGVFGNATGTTGTTYGVFGKTASNKGIGVYGLGGDSSTNSAKTYIGTTGFGVLGESAYGFGVVGMSDFTAGVLGASGTDCGVIGASDGYYGVLGHSWWVGVGGQSTSGDGVRGTSQSGFGVFAFSETGIPLLAMLGSAASNKSIIEGRQDGTTRFRVTGGGEVYASGSFHPNGADFAEMLPAENSLEPGDVLVIGEDGKLARCTQPYQENVAGVHATKPGLLGGAHDGADLAGKSPLAVVGIVPVKVTSENGPIKPGDKLTTSSTPGHAMKAGKHAEIGTVIGKALSALHGDRDVITMLVILQ